MRRSICSRADLLRTLEHNDPAITAAMATLLGYHETPLGVEPEQPPTTSPRSSKRKTATVQDTPYEPADVPFWRIEAYEAVTRDDDTTRELSRTTPVPIPHWRGRPQQAPGFTPLAPRRTVLTRLRRVSAIRRASAEIDLEATVDLLSRGDLLHDVPHRYRRAWGAAIHIIEDRARRLVPYWLDQEDVVDMLRRLYPPYGVTIARIGDGDSVPMVRWPEERRGQYGLPAPGTLVLVLGDLGCLATQGEHLRRFWVHWGHLLRDNGNPAVALVPTLLQDIPPELTRLWTVVRWDAGTATGVAGVMPSPGDAVQRLLTLLSPVVRLEPGLLRAVRCLLPEGRRDAGLEARLWQDAAIVSQHSVAATLDPEWRKMSLARFAAQPTSLQQLVLEQVGAWRAQVSEAVWFEEVLSLDPQVQRTAVEAADLEDAMQFFLALVATLSQAGQIATGTEAWACRLLQRLPAAVWNDRQGGTVVHELYALVRPYLDATQVPAGYDPAVLSPVGQPVRQVAVWQVAEQVLFRVVEPSAPAESHVVMRGSSLGVVHTASGEVKIAPGQRQRPIHEFWHGGQPPAWAQRWGDDEYGPWVTFRVQDVEQRLRWIPPGRFLMGSPADEEGRYDDEGPQHEVQLTRGFWVFDTPCTQALWQAVMGGNPSHFKGLQRPVEEVSWEDCQTFLAQLNALMPGLDVRLPTEAQWEYACRAGTETARYHEDIDAIAWYEDNSRGETHEVGQKQANAWGLYDMLGNMEEWCHDGERKYTRRMVVDPMGPLDAATNRALRGGSWIFSAQPVRAAYRVGNPPGLCNNFMGFRGASSCVSQPGAARATWSALKRQAEPAPTATRQPAARLLTLHGQASLTTAMPDGEGCVISTDREQLHVGRITRPAWATEIGRDAYGLWVVFAVQGIRQRLRWIPPGRFLMGSPEDEAGRFGNEGPQHDVQITQGFWLFDTPCTQALWQAVMGRNPSHFKGEQLPVEHVSWKDCQRFLQTLHTHVPIVWRLPTEAQWEYACRAGTQTARYAVDVDVIAWYNDNSNGTTHAVGQKRPNAWGIYDMLGNVYEWCHDGRRDYEASAVTNPIGQLDAASDRALRGGSWGLPAQDARAACRLALRPGGGYAGLGFRGASSG